MASVVKVAFDRGFSGLTPRTVREICGFGKASGRGERRSSGLTQSRDRMLSAATGGGNQSQNVKKSVITRFLITCDGRYFLRFGFDCRLRLFEYFN